MNYYRVYNSLKQLMLITTNYELAQRLQQSFDRYPQHLHIHVGPAVKSQPRR